MILRQSQTSNWERLNLAARKHSPSSRTSMSWRRKGSRIVWEIKRKGKTSDSTRRTNNGNQGSDKSRLDTKTKGKCSKMRFATMRFSIRFRLISSSIKSLSYSKKFNSSKSIWLRINKVWRIFKIKTMLWCNSRTMLSLRKDSILLIKLSSWPNK